MIEPDVVGLIGLIGGLILYLAATHADSLMDALKDILSIFVDIVTFSNVRTAHYRIKHVREYIEYSSPDVLESKWMKEISGLSCGFCGCDDAPIVRTGTNNKPQCKWCAELMYLNKHLRGNGLRRFQKEIKRGKRSIESKQAA